MAGARKRMAARGTEKGKVRLEGRQRRRKLQERVPGEHDEPGRDSWAWRREEEWRMIQWMVVREGKWMEVKLGWDKNELGGGL